MNRYSDALERMIVARDANKQFIAHPHLKFGASRREQACWKDDDKVLERATPHYWTAQCTEALQAIAPAFKPEDLITTREMLHCDYAWHWFGERPLFYMKPARVEEKDEDPLPVVALSWGWATYSGDPAERPGGARAFASNEPVWLKKTTDPFSKPNLRFIYCSTAWVINPAFGHLTPTNSLWVSALAGEKLFTVGAAVDTGPDDEDSRSETHQLARYTVAIGTFLRQRLIGTNETPVERHARKRLQRAGNRTPDIHVTYLRKPKRELPEDHVPAEVQWNYQWSVGAHVRQQWYASCQKHLPVLIMPYMKGPEDKPVKPRTTPLIAVTR